MAEHRTTGHHKFRPAYEASWETDWQLWSSGTYYSMALFTPGIVGLNGESQASHETLKLQWQETRLPWSEQPEKKMEYLVAK